MRIRTTRTNASSFPGLVLACVLAAAAPAAQAQPAASDLDVSADAPAEDRARPDTPPEQPEEFNPDAPPPGTEIRVIVAGESESAAAYAAGDSVAGFNAADLEALGALNVADIADFTPNLEIVTGASATTPTFFIRGIGLNDFNSNSSGAVAIFADDVAINSPAMQLSTFFDIEDVSVLRGPVGKGAARNASAGAIKVYSRKPRGGYNGYLRSSYGNYDFNDFEGAFEAPIYKDVLLGRIAFRASHRDGFVTNKCGGAPPAFDPITGQQLRALGTRTGDKDPPASICGESVREDEFSPLPANLPIDVNNLGNWAARGTIRFQPTLDQDWLINGHVAERDEYTRQGLSYGTGGNLTFPDGSTVDGQLGGADGQNNQTAGFRRPEAKELRQAYAAIFNAPVPSRCAAIGCTPQQERAALRAGLNAAEIAVANTIGQNLDHNPYNGYYNRIGDTRNLVYGTYIRGDIVLPNSLYFTTISGYDAYDRFQASDTDQSPNVLFEIETDDEGWQFYQNFELEGTLEEQPIDWNMGAFYLQESLDVRIDNDFGNLNNTGGVAAREYTQDTLSAGVYGGFAYDFWDDFTFDGGVRFNFEKKTIDYRLERNNEVTDFQSRIRTAPSGEVRLTYNFREDTHAYWKYTRGWKGGHFNATSSLRQGVTYAEPEENNAYEVGLRGSWFDARLNGSASFFYYDYFNYQIFTVQNDVGANPEFIVLNASDVQVLGAEAEIMARPWDNTSFTARFGWLESKFIDFVQRQVIQVDVPNVGPIDTERDVNFSNNRLLNAPQFKISLTAEHTVQLGRYGALTMRYDAAWTDTVYFDATQGRGLPNVSQQRFILPPDTIGQKPYWLHNLLFKYRPPMPGVTVEFFVRNLTDEVYKSFAFDAVQFQKTTIFFTGEPRMYGGTLSVSF